MMAGGREDRVIKVAVQRVEQEQAAEEQHLLGQERPHAQARGLLLVVEALEVMGQGGMVFAGARQRWPPPLSTRSCRPARQRPAAPRSSRSAAASWPATRGPWRPTGWPKPRGRNAWSRSGSKAAAGNRRPGP